MPYLVDGDNLLGTWPGRARSEAGRRSLAAELGRFATQRGRRVVVVFDGTAPAGVRLGADVLFAGAGCRADDVILSLLRREQDRRGWIVVTSDRSLGDRCRHLEARVERADLFRKRLVDRAAEEKPEREDDLDFWLDKWK